MSPILIPRFYSFFFKKMGPSVFSAPPTAARGHPFHNPPFGRHTLIACTNLFDSHFLHSLKLQLNPTIFGCSLGIWTPGFKPPGGSRKFVMNYFVFFVLSVALSFLCIATFCPGVR